MPLPETPSRSLCSGQTVQLGVAFASILCITCRLTDSARFSIRVICTENIGAAYRVSEVHNLRAHTTMQPTSHRHSHLRRSAVGDAGHPATAPAVEHHLHTPAGNVLRIWGRALIYFFALAL